MPLATGRLLHFLLPCLAWLSAVGAIGPWVGGKLPRRMMPWKRAMALHDPRTQTATKQTLQGYPKAKCLDGSPGAYYWRPGVGDGRSKFLVYRQGGGFAENLDGCLLRSQTNIGSSRDAFWGDTVDLSHYNLMGFSMKPDQNPLLHNWNHIMVIYCDGMYFAGSNETPTVHKGVQLHFRGADIMTAVLDDLGARHGLGSATDVVIGGCSAGGLSTFQTVDWAAAHPSIPARARVAGLSCSGYYLDYNFEATRFSDKKKFPYWMGNMSGALSKECLADHGHQPHMCLISEVNAPYVRTPLFMWDSVFDIYMLQNVLRSAGCMQPECANPHSHKYREALRELWRAQPTMGAFVDACSHHCEDVVGGTLENLAAIEGLKPLQAFYVWYKSYVPQRGHSPATPPNGSGMRIWEVDHGVTYPCFQCCPLFTAQQLFPVPGRAAQPAGGGVQPRPSLDSASGLGGDFNYWTHE